MSRPIAAIEVNEIPDGGPAVPVELTTDAPEGGPALPVVRVAAGSRAQVAIAPVRMRLVTSGVRARTGRRPVPIVVVAGDTPTTPVPPPSPLLTDLAARWSMDEAAGNRLDSGPNALHLSPTGTPTQEIGKLGMAVGTSVGNYLSRADHAALRLRAGMTWAAWVYVSAAGTAAIASKDNDGGAREWILLLGGGAYTVYLFNTVGGFAGATAAAVVPLDTWIHYAVTFDLSQTLCIFINGTAVGTTPTLAGTPNGTTQAVVVGRQNLVNNNYSLTGRVDELTIWHRALTAPEIALHCNGGAGIAWPYT